MLYKYYIYLVIIHLIFNTGCKNSNKTKTNKIVIENSEFITNENVGFYFLPFYEDRLEYVPFDFFHSINFSREASLQINYLEDGTIRIINLHDTEFEAKEIQIEINKNLEVINASYFYSHDVEDGSITSYYVEDVILILNKTPFNGVENLIGRYTLKLLNKKRRISVEKDSLYYTTYKGKFKFYDDEEKEMGLDWVKSQNEIKAVIKHSNNVYNNYAVDEPAKLEFNEIIFPDYDGPSHLLPEKTSTKYAVFIVDENGNVIKDSIEFEEAFTETEAEKIKQQILSLGLWKPAIHKCKRVKSKVRFNFSVKG